MTQISADRDQDKQTAQELRRACPERHSTFVEALVSRACERQAVGQACLRNGNGTATPSQVSEFHSAPAFFVSLDWGAPSLVYARRSR
jgi:hypothetical protein